MTSGSYEHKQRIQLKFGYHGREKHTKIGFELVSRNANPVSTNQTLSESFSTKGIQLDQAYIQFFFLSEFNLLAGKFKNPFRNQGSSLIYDSDLRPEGIVAQYRRTFLSNTKVYAQVGLFQLIQKPTNFILQMIPMQMGIYFSKIFNGAVSLTKYTHLRGKRFLVNINQSFGNDRNTDTTYSTGFRILDVYSQFALSEAIEIPFAVKLTGNFTYNLEVNSNNIGWLTGIQIGKNRKKNIWTWQVKMEYQNLKANAVLEAFTDSDFHGGGTDNKGAKLSGTITISKNVLVSTQAFVFQSNINGDKNSQIATYQFDTKWFF